MAEDDTPSSPIASIDDLLSIFHAAEKPPKSFRIGTESEKIGVYRDSLSPVPYEGQRGIQAVLSALSSRFGYTPEGEYEGGPILALRRDGASITLEPGGQLELSGAPLRTIHEAADEHQRHIAELHEVSAPLDIVWLGIGFHPYARLDELPWVPKMRYGVMRRYLPTRGSMALDMMQRTCTVQANLDYASEEDAVRKLRLALRIQPVVTALFANSPYEEGRASAFLSRRAEVWLHMDPDRSGLLPFAWEGDMSYRRYVEWALDVPMFIVKRGDRLIDNTGQTFRRFMAEGCQGHRATLADWEAHINSLFPEARLKKTLEVRGADGQRTGMIPALPAFWKGLMYDPLSLDRAEAIAERFTYAQVERARHAIPTRALRAPLGDHQVGDVAEELLAVSEEGLARIAHLDEEGRDETFHLAPLEALLRQRKTPAEVLLESVGREPRAAAFLEGAAA